MIFKFNVKRIIQYNVHGIKKNTSCWNVVTSISLFSFSEIITKQKEWGIKAQIPFRIKQTAKI